MQGAWQQKCPFPAGVPGRAGQARLRRLHCPLKGACEGLLKIYLLINQVLYGHVSHCILMSHLLPQMHEGGDKRAIWSSGSRMPLLCSELNPATQALLSEDTVLAAARASDVAWTV